MENHRARHGRDGVHQDHARALARALRLRVLGLLGPLVGRQNDLAAGGDVLFDEGNGRVDGVLGLGVLVPVDVGDFPGLGLVGKGGVAVPFAVRVDQNDRGVGPLGVFGRLAGLRLGDLPALRILSRPGHGGGRLRVASTGIFVGHVLAGGGPPGDRFDGVFVRPVLVVDLNPPLFAAAENSQHCPQRDARS